MKNKILFLIISVVFMSTLDILYGQNVFSADKPVYTLSITENDVIVLKIDYGYEIYIRKKGDSQGIKLMASLENGRTSYLYFNNTGLSNSIVNISRVVLHPVLGEAFYAYIPDNLFLDSVNKNAKFTLKNNMSIIAQTYNLNYKAFLNNIITLKTKEVPQTRPSISVISVSKEGDLYAFYLSYSGGDNGNYAFYVREGKTNTAYKLIPTFWGYDKKDNMAIVIEDTYQEGVGKKLYIKAYFKEIDEDRYLAFNVFDSKGKTPTYPIDYILKGTNIIKSENPPPLPSGGDVEDANVRTIIKSREEPARKPPVERKTIVERTPEVKPPVVKEAPKTVTVVRDDIVKTEAIDSIKNIVEAFNGSSDYVKDANELSSKIKNTVMKHKTDSIDLVIVLDTTASMLPYINSIKSDILNISEEIFKNYKYARIGFVIYRDIGDSYITKKVDFLDNAEDIANQIKRFSAHGGGDKAEPMYEAIDRALKVFNFEAQTKLILVVTDAPAKYIGFATLESTSALAKDKGVILEVILTSGKNEN